MATATAPRPPRAGASGSAIAALLVPCALATLVGVALLWPTSAPTPGTGTCSRSTPSSRPSQGADCTQGSGDGGCVALLVRMAGGPLPGRDLVQLVPLEPGTPRFATGDQVVVEWSGATPPIPAPTGSRTSSATTRCCGSPSSSPGRCCCSGGGAGSLRSARSALSFVVLLVFVLPAILSGHDPLAVAVVGSALIMFAVLYLTHGLSARTSTAVLGTLLSLALIGALGAAFSAAARLTGLDDQTTDLIAALGTGIDARGLLLAGMVIGALGVLDDVTVTQTSAVWELRRANPDLGARELFARGDADRPRPRRLRGEHARARLRGRRAAADAAVQPRRSRAWAMW